MSLKLILNIESVRFPLTGIGRYTYELASVLRRQEAIQALRLFSSGNFLDEIPSVDYAPEVSDSSMKTYGLKKRLQKSPWVLEIYRRLFGVLRSDGLKGYEDHLYHGPNFFLPRFEGRCIATFHDLSPFTWSHCLEPSKVHYMQKELQYTLQRADRLITVSEYIRRELCEFSGRGMDTIDAVQLAAAIEFQPRNELQLRRFLNKYQLKYQAYTLFVGTIEPRKNILSILHAYEKLPFPTRQRFPLVLAGHEGWKSDDIHAAIQKAQRQGWVKYLGYLPAQELPALFSGARLFVFPSLYEGFGLPVLEAMQSGIPVVCSNSASLPEVTGDAALMCEAMDVGHLSQLISQGLEDIDWRGHAVLKGLKQASKFSWERCGNETLAVYNKLMDNG